MADEMPSPGLTATVQALFATHFKDATVRVSVNTVCISGYYAIELQSPEAPRFEQLLKDGTLSSLVAPLFEKHCCIMWRIGPVREIPVWVSPYSTSFPPPAAAYPTSYPSPVSLYAPYGSFQ
jgi:hypothetical protein